MEITASETLASEKDLDPAMRKLWLKAHSAFETQNFKYAKDLLATVLKNEPAFLEGRRMLREAVIRITSNKKKSFLSLGGLGGMKFGSLVKKDAQSAIVKIEEALEKDPFDVPANQALHDAATRLGMVELATFALETIRRGHPDNTRNLHQLAEYYSDSDDPSKAREIYEEIVRKDPTDGDAQKGARTMRPRSP